MTRTVLFRCDGNHQSGMGHLGRCMALAEGLQETGWKASFLGAFSPTTVGRLEAAGCSHIAADFETGTPADQNALQRLAQENRADLVVLDNYQITPAYASAVRQNGVTVAVIDDFAAWPSYPVDTILNFTLGAATYHYPAGPHLLLGPAYLPMRRKFKDVRHNSAHKTGGVRRVALVLSGDRTGAGAFTALRILTTCGDVEIRIVLPRTVTDTRPFTEGLPSGHNVEIIMEPPDLAAVLDGMDLVVCTGGLVKYEAGYLGVIPAIVSNVPGEKDDTTRWAAAGIGFDLGLTVNIGDHAFAEGLRRIMALDTEVLNGMKERCHSLFPADCTLNAAHGLAHNVGIQATP